MLNKKALAATAAGAEALYVEDVFSTYLYTGTGSSRSIVNNIDLSGEGGLVWIKSRSAVNFNTLNDTARGAQKDLYTDYSGGTYPETANANGLTAFNADGFSVGSYSAVNENGTTHVSWTFRKAEKFFDVVTYTGDGASSKTISHNLGSTPGCIIVKCRSNTYGWRVYHRGTTSPAEGNVLQLNTTDAEIANGIWGNTAPTSTNFTVGNGSSFPAVNANGETYVAYLFAHDAGGFGDAGDQSVIKCGSFTGTDGTFVDLGWEPQWVLIKASSTSGSWLLMDNMRGLVTGGNDQYLVPNASDAEGPSQLLDLNPTGFTVKFSAAGATYVYIAIRRGPMKTPEAGTDVHSAVTWTGNNAARNITGFGFPLDMAIARVRNDAGASRYGITFDRIRGIVSSASGARILQTTSTNAEANYSPINGIDLMTGFKIADGDRSINDAGTPNTYVAWGFKRAPGFFDVVCYTGTGVARTVNHNLGVAPELMIVRSRSNASNWEVYAAPLGATKYLRLDLTSAAGTYSDFWNDTAPTSSVFSVATDADVNGSGRTYVAYLFGSVTGVSKVGSYTGNGSSQTINCGFTTGARFILIKRTDGTGDWYIYDSARGIDSGSDPQIKLNTTSAEATGYDAVDPDNSGFIVNNDGTNFPINANGTAYIYLAIA